MTPTRRGALALMSTAPSMLALALATLAGPAAAQGAYPSAKPITLIVPTAAGGTTDISARMLAEALQKEIGQAIVVDNRGGASGGIAAMAVKQAPADGYTLLMQYSGYHTITPVVVKTPLKWDPVKDFAPVANVISAPQLVVTRGNLPYNSLKELVADAKANPGKLTYASSGNGSLQHATGSMLEQQNGVQLVHVPYKGTGPTLTDLLGGQVDMSFGTPPPFVAHVKGGKLKALAVTGPARLPSLPDVPTTTEAGFPKLDATSWFAVFAPTGTPQPIVDQLSAAIKKVTESDAFKKKAEEQGATADYMSPKQLGDLTRKDLARWAEIAKTANIQAD